MGREKTGSNGEKGIGETEHELICAYTASKLSPFHIIQWACF